MITPPRVLWTVALALAVASPLTARAEPCPATIDARCTSVEVSGKRYQDGQESTVKCKSTGGHTADVEIGAAEIGVILSLMAGSPECTPVVNDLSEPGEDPGRVVLVGGLERRTAANGKPKNDCIFTGNDAVSGPIVDPARFSDANGTLKYGVVSEFDDRLRPSEVKGSLVYRRTRTEGAISFIGTFTLKQCSAAFDS